MSRSKERREGFINLGGAVWYIVAALLVASVAMYVAMNSVISSQRKDIKNLSAEVTEQKRNIELLESSLAQSESRVTLLTGLKEELERALVERSETQTRLEQEIAKLRGRLPATIRPNTPEDTPEKREDNSLKRIEIVWEAFCKSPTEVSNPSCQGAVK